MYSYFTHPQKVCMSYFEHCCFSLSLAQTFAFGTVAAVVHAFFPNAYLTHSTDMVKDVTETLQNAGCKSLNNEDE